ncbi:hypothetical protein [Shewanella algae]|uniref:HNH endonuclease n=1 Tax=Shewanella algae TaxID=38313 RepID=UPI0031F4F78F
MSSLYYPILRRQDLKNYYKKRGGGGFYATYNCKANYDNISIDCKYRCVYCDAHVDECGGENFSLDHFRPTDIFGDKFNGILKTHPFNLHLSCQKCNVLKTNDWKGCKTTTNGVTYISSQGYIDRFEDDINKYMIVDRNGFVKCINKNGPAKYMIAKMLLNRTNRVYIRKRREVKYKSAIIYEMLIKNQRKLINDIENNSLSIEEIKIEMKKLQNLFEKFNKLNLISL